MSKKYTVDGRPRKSGAGKFFLGLFLGFVICVATIFGCLWFVYENLSVKWLNDTFKIGLDLGSQELNDKTVKDLIATATSIVDKVNTYTLNDIDNDFGISLGDKLMGIDITDIQNVPVKDLPDALQKKFANISADELKDVLDLSEMNFILDLTNTYYVADGKLYEDEEKTKEVDSQVIKYTITSDNKVVIKKQTRAIENGAVEFELRFLPLTRAFGDFKNTMGDRFTIDDLVNEFNINLPEYIVEGNENKTLNELEGTIDGLLLADFLGFELVGEKVYNGTNEVTGIVATLAKKTVEDLNDIENIIDTSSVADVLGFTYENGVYKDTNGNEVSGIMKSIAGTEIQNLATEVKNMTVAKALGFTLDGTVYKDTDGNAVKGIMKAIAGTKIDELDGVINNMTVLTALGYTVEGTGTNKVYKDENGAVVTGALTLIDLENTKVADMATAMQSAITSKTLFDLQKAGVIDQSLNLNTTIEKTGTSFDNVKLGNLYIDDTVELLIALVDMIKTLNP